MAYPRARVLASLLLAACGGVDDGARDAAPPACADGQVECAGLQLRTCAGGEFVPTEQCGFACDPTGGCTDCDPTAGDTCDGGDVVACLPTGDYGALVEACAEGSSCQAGVCTRTCTADGVDLIYVVDDMYRLLSFDPRLISTPGGPFTLIGPITCPASTTPAPGWGGAITPFSMAVDRDAVAWVLYASGEIFQVSTQDASCTATSFAPSQEGMDLFGMAFVADAAGADTERLFIAGGAASALPGGALASVDPTTLDVGLLGTVRADSEYSPELTGTGAAELFGFYPGIDLAFVQEIDRTTGAGVGTEYGIPGGLGGADGDFVQAWAFAQWGGKFYLFVTTSDGITSNSTVRSIDRATGGAVTVLEDLPYVIVGAGVSTCAPTMIE